MGISALFRGFYDRRVSAPVVVRGVPSLRYCFYSHYSFFKILRLLWNPRAVSILRLMWAIAFVAHTISGLFVLVKPFL